ncbi:hypothetical protein SNK04_012396 [Fusarium graminearum]
MDSPPPLVNKRTVGCATHAIFNLNLHTHVKNVNVQTYASDKENVPFILINLHKRRALIQLKRRGLQEIVSILHHDLRQDRIMPISKLQQIASLPQHQTQSLQIIA